MYNIITIRDTIRIPPKLFSKSLEDSVLKALIESYESKFDKDLGVVITVMNPREIGHGKIIPGDGAAYHDVVFDILTFKPEVHELVRGEISDITEFGAFMKFGPIDGLIHVSQIADDFMSYNEKNKVLSGRETKKVLKVGDEVMARIIAVSTKSTITESKINLTMRQEGLGKAEWWEKKTTRTKKTRKIKKKTKKKR